MRSAGIICECNPPHAGHQSLIQKARLENDCVVCLLSGPFVQRGEASILTSRARAGILLEMGADLVLEFPFPFCTSGAESFASAGVNILTRLGIGELWFGSECGDLTLLQKLSDIAASEDFSKEYASRIGRTSTGTASAYFSALAEMAGISEPLSPNDILAISYLCAIRSQNSNLVPRVFKRMGAPDRQTNLQEGEIPSATALRNAILTGNLQDVYSKLDEFEIKIIRGEAASERFPITLEHASRAVLAYLRLSDPAALDNCAEVSGGLGRRLGKNALMSTCLSDLYNLSATKKYPLSRVRRGLLFAMLGVTCHDLRRKPAYVTILGSGKTGQAFLSSIRRSSDLPVVSKRSSVPRNPDSVRQKELSDAALSLYALCYPKPVSAAELIRGEPPIKPENL